MTIHQVSSCPINKETWSKRAHLLNCTGEKEYHCAIANNRKFMIETCLEKSSIAAGNCPEILPSGYLDWWRCNKTDPQCPKEEYLTTEVYKYPLCYGELAGDKGPKSTSRGVETGQDTGKIVGTILGGVLAIGVMVILSIVAVRYIRKKRRTPYAIESRRDSTQNPETTALTDSQSDLGRDSFHIPDVDSVEGSGGFILTEAIETGLEYIKNNSNMLIIGKLGSSVSKTCKTITTKFVEENSRWKSFHFNYRDIPPSYNKKKNPIVFVDGWFGLWNDDPGELENVQHVLKNLLQRERESNCKIVVGMRSDICERYKKHLVGICPKMFNDLISLDALNRGKKDELEKHFKNKFNRKGCKVQGCMCKELKLDWIDGKDFNIGEFLKIDILSIIHSLIPKWSESDLKLALIDHFEGLENTDKELYHCLMYVVLKGMYIKGDDLDLELTESTNMSITKDSFDRKMESSLKKYLTILPYARVVNKTRLSNETGEQEKKAVVFWHVFLYICAFHAIYKKHTEILLKHCNMHAIMQLVRSEEDDSPFIVTVKTDSHDHLLLKERLKAQENQNHPLLKALEKQN